MPSIVAGYVVTLLDDDQGVLYTAFLPHVCLLYLTINQSLDMIARTSWLLTTAGLTDFGKFSISYQLFQYFTVNFI